MGVSAEGGDSYRETSFILFKLAVGGICFFVVYLFANQRSKRNVLTIKTKG